MNVQIATTIEALYVACDVLSDTTTIIFFGLSNYLLNIVS